MSEATKFPPQWRVTVTLQPYSPNSDKPLPPAEIVWLKAGASMDALVHVLNAFQHEDTAPVGVEVLAIKVERVHSEEETATWSREDGERLLKVYDEKGGEQDAEGN